MTKYTNREVAEDFVRWQEYVDPNAEITKADFDALTISEREKMVEEAFGTNEQQNERLLDDLEYQGDLIIVFGDTGVNKTVHAVQAADRITGGKSDLGLECE